MGVAILEEPGEDENGNKNLQTFAGMNTVMSSHVVGW